MVCDDVQPEELTAFADGELSPPDADRVQAHVEACADCQAALDAHRGLDAMLEAFEVPEGPAEGFLARLHERIESAPVASESGAAGGLPAGARSPVGGGIVLTGFWRWAGLAAAAVLVAAVGYAVWGGPGAGTDRERVAQGGDEPGDLRPRGLPTPRWAEAPPLSGERPPGGADGEGDDDLYADASSIDGVEGAEAAAATALFAERLLEFDGGATEGASAAPRVGDGAAGAIGAGTGASGGAEPQLALASQIEEDIVAQLDLLEELEAVENLELLEAIEVLEDPLLALLDEEGDGR